MRQYILFDLDGTLTDSKLGITTCVQHALKELGIDEPDRDKLEPFIGPPLKDSFKEYYNMDDATADLAVEKYRERYNTVGLFENEVYRGIIPMLAALQGKGIHMAVASNKPTVYVKRILEHFHMDRFFDVVIGSELDGRRASKKEVISEVLNRFSTIAGKAISRDKILMVGDRKYDIEAAKQLKIDSLGVTYGYGSREELCEAHADYLVTTVEELQRFLLRGYENDRSKATPFQKAWLVVWNLLVFIVVRTLVTHLVNLVFLEIGGMVEGGAMVGGAFDRFLFLRDETGVGAGLSANAQLISLMIANIAGVLGVLKTAKFVLGKTKEDMELTHIKGEPLGNYGFLALATVGLVIGLNIFSAFSGMTSASESYAQAAENQASVAFLLGILVYGLVAPVCEEIVFRGIIFNYLRRFFNVRVAIFVSAVLFGGFHMNGVQAVYAFGVGCLLAYAYEYFGDFRVPVVMHMAANILVFILGRFGLFAGSFVNSATCLFFMALAGITLWYLVRQKNVM